MAQKCEICKKTSMMVQKRVKLREAKHNPTVKKRKYPNLQWVRLPVSKAGFPAGKKIKACAKCIKALSKNK